MKLWISALALIALCASPVLAQNIWRVPEDYPTIKDAHSAALPGDTILIGPGTYCGATIGKQLTIVGEGQPTITATSCGAQTVGLWLTPAATGTVIQHINFSALVTGIYAMFANDVTIQHNSFSGLTLGIGAMAANDVTVEHNTMELAGPGAAGIDSRGGGSDWIVSHNAINIEASNNGRGIQNWLGNGWTLSHNKLTGTGLTLGIWLNRPLFYLPAGRAVNNTAKFNYIDGAKDGVGIKVTTQYGAVVRDNSIFMPSSSDNPPGVCGAWGIEIHDSRVYNAGQPVLGSVYSLISNNDTRGTAVGVIFREDRLGGIENSVGNVLHGNFGTYAIHQPDSPHDDPCSGGEITGEIKNRAASSLIACGDDGICRGLPLP